MKLTRYNLVETHPYTGIRDDAGKKMAGLTEKILTFTIQDSNGEFWLLEMSIENDMPQNVKLRIL